MEPGIEVFPILQGFLGVALEKAPGGSQGGRPAVTLEEFFAEGFFNALNSPAEGGGADVAFLTGPPKMEGVGEVEKEFEGVRVHSCVSIFEIQYVNVFTILQ